MDNFFFGNICTKLLIISLTLYWLWVPGLQIQATENKIYNGPGDAVKKIISQHGLAGLYKGQVPTLWREAIGYGAYFWAYEKLMQREIRNGVKREDVSPVKAVLFGAAAGYAVSFFFLFAVVWNCPYIMR